MSGTRIPETIPGFNTYINSTDDYLQAGTVGPPPLTNRERLGLSIQNGMDWSTKRIYWRDTLFPKHSNPLTKTTAVNKEVQLFMKNFRTFANPLLNIIAADPDVTNDDANVFNIDIERAEPSVSETVITDPVVAEHTSLNGGMVEFVCRPSSDSANPSKHDDADSIQFAYLLQAKISNTPAPVPDPNPTPDPGGELPDPDSSSMTREIFTKAVFVKSFGVTKKGSLLIAYLRWYNTKHPNLSGPWTGPFVIGIA